MISKTIHSIDTTMQRRSIRGQFGLLYNSAGSILIFQNYKIYVFVQHYDHISSSHSLLVNIGTSIQKNHHFHISFYKGDSSLQLHKV